MNVDLTLQDLLEVQAYFDLPGLALVEKDYYVTKALAAIHSADTEPFSLAFGGGTSLCCAYRLIRRMSEDVDLKIVSDHEPTRPELRKLRERITEALLAAGFYFNPIDRAQRDSRNESRYTVFRIPYATLTSGEGVLRPEIQIEATVSSLRCPPVALQLRSFVAEALKLPAEVENFACVSITQTAAEKFVALTRRVAAEIADEHGSRDTSLIRHMYDLHVTRSHYDLNEVAGLIKVIMQHDALLFGNLFPAYRDNPYAETRAAISAFRVDPRYMDNYVYFHRNMVYGEAIDFASCLLTLEELADLVLVRG